MTVPKKLVFDGSKIKARCEERRVDVGGVCYLDWCRFTISRAAVKFPELFPSVASLWQADRYDHFWLREIDRELKDIRKSNVERAQAIEQAFFVAGRVADALGNDFRLGPLLKGHDFYAYRIPIMLNDDEVGSVMCWSSSDSKRQRGQRDTINVNLHGSACTFAQKGWEARIHAIGTGYCAVLTTVHLAVDFFDGLAGGLESVIEDYRSGVFDHLGKRPKIGDVNWLQGHSRSIYFGSKEAGKQTNFYEKGDQLYGADEARERGVKWVRAELRWGNKLRVLDWDMLLRPADFFAGASEAHHQYLLLADAQQVQPQNLPCNRPDAPMQIEAEVARVIRWARQTAGATFATIFRFMDDARLASLVDEGGLPGRLRRFSKEQIKSAFDSIELSLAPVGSPAV